MEDVYFAKRNFVNNKTRDTFLVSIVSKAL